MINNWKNINYNWKVWEKRILQIPSQQFECNGLWILNCFSLFPIEIAWPDLRGPAKISILVTHHWLISYLERCLDEYSNRKKTTSCLFFLEKMSKLGYCHDKFCSITSHIFSMLLLGPTFLIHIIQTALRPSLRWKANNSDKNIELFEF